jgi:hypothetical protein
MPTQLKFGCFTYKIEVMSANDAELDRVYGDTNHLSRKIRFRPAMEAQELADTFIHEALHAMCRFHDLNDEDDEETYVTRLAHALCAFWRDNPKAADWWTKLNASAA